MHRKSITTFDNEMESVGGIPGLLWGNLSDFRREDDPLRGFEAEPDDMQTFPDDVEVIEGIGNVRLRDPDALEDVLEYRFGDAGPGDFSSFPSFQAANSPVMSWGPSGIIPAEKSIKKNER
jgi:hypothetical protein